MAVYINSEEGKILRKLIPLETYPKAAFQELCTNITVEQVQDDYLFKRGDTDKSLVYLLAGSVSLQAEGLVVDIIEAKSESARFALAHQIPRKIDALANGAVRIVRLNADLINNPPPLQSRDEGYTIIEDGDVDSDDWLNAMLRVPLIQTLPPAILQKLLVSITTVQYNEGDVIIDTGMPVEHFYLLTKGQCQRARISAAGAIERKLQSGDSFGDEYLILEVPARERIVALTPVTLVQIKKEQFFEQVLGSLMRQIDADQARELINKNALMLDVRAKQLAEKAPLEAGLNIPFVNLINKIGDLDQKRKIITCADEKTSMAAAFLLMKYDFDVYALNDGSIAPEPEPEFIIPADHPEVAVETAPVKERQNNEDENSVQPINRKLKGKQAQKTLNPEAELRFLRTENQRLTAYNQRLEEKVRKLSLEKKKLSMRVQLIELQLKKLKEIMIQFSKNKPG